MAVDDNLPKTGEPKAPAVGASSSDDVTNGANGGGNKMSSDGSTAVGKPTTPRAAGGGRRKQNRPMRLVCSLVDAADTRLSDDDEGETAAVPGLASMTADYPVDYGTADSPSFRPEDFIADPAVRRRQQPLRRRHRGDDDDDEVDEDDGNDDQKSGDFAADALDGDDEMARLMMSANKDVDDDDNGEENEFPTRYHQLGNELRREVETADSRLERIMHAEAAARRSAAAAAMMMSDQQQQQRHKQATPGVDFQLHDDMEVSETEAGDFAFESTQPQNYRLRRHHFADNGPESDATSSYGAALDFTIQSRTNNNEPSTRQQQYTGCSESSSSVGGVHPTASQQQRQQHGGHHHQHHHHYHHQPQQQQHQQQQQSHHRSSYPSSFVDQTGSTGSLTSAVLTPHANSSSVHVDSEDYCDRCQKHFCNKYYLRKHRQDVHGIAPSTDASAAQQQQAQHAAATATGAFPGTATVQQLYQQQQQSGDSCSPVPSSSSSGNLASVLPYQQLLNSLPFVLPFHQQQQQPPAGLPGPVMSSGSSMLFQSPSTAIASSSLSSSSAGPLQRGGECSVAGSPSAPPSSAAATSAAGGLLPSLTSLMLLNPFALLNAPSFLQSQAALAAAGLAAAAGMNLTASTSLNTLAEMQKSGGAAGNAGSIFPSGDEGPLMMAGLLPPFLGGPVDSQSSLLSTSAASGALQQPQQTSASRPSADDLSSSPSSTASSSTASYHCDMCRKEFCSSHFLAVHRRDKHGISLPPTTSNDSPSATGVLGSSQVAAAAATAAAGLKLPSTALSDVIRLLTATNGRTPLDASLGALGSPDGAEPGEKISGSVAGGSRAGKQSSNDKTYTTSSSSATAGASRGAVYDRLPGLPLPPAGLPGLIGSTTGGPDDVCCLCKKQFPNRYGLVLHLLTAHNVRPEGFGLAGELLQFDGLLSGGLMGPGGPALLLGGGGSLPASASTTGSAGRPTSSSSSSLSVRNSTGNVGSMMTPSSSSSSKQSDRVSCDICNKEVCNKYFLKTHKIKVHGVDSSVAGSYVPPPVAARQYQPPPETGARSSDMSTVSPPADVKPGRDALAASLKHEEMRKGLMLADSQLNSFAAHLDLALKKDSFGLAGLAGLPGLGPPLPPGSVADQPSSLLHPPPSMSASDLFRLFTAVGSTAGKPDDPFGLSSAFGLKSLGMPELTDHLAATMAAAAAAATVGSGGDARSRSSTSSLSDVNIPQHSSSSSSVVGSYYKDSAAGASSSIGLNKNRMPSVAGSGNGSSSANSGSRHQKEHHHLRLSSTSSSLNASGTSTSGPLGSLPPSSAGGVDRPALSEQDLIQSGIDPEAYCELCQKEFCSKYFLRTHRQKIHGVGSGSTSGKSSDSSSATGSSTALSGGGALGGMMLGAGAFDPFRSLTGNPTPGVPTLPPGTMPLLPLFQGLLPPFSAVPPGVSSQLLMQPDAAGLLGAETLGGAHVGGLPAGLPPPPVTSRSSGSREAANATRVTCEVCGKELCNKYFLKTHMAKIHGTQPSSTSQSSRDQTASQQQYHQPQLHQVSTTGVVADAVLSQPNEGTGSSANRTSTSGSVNPDNGTRMLQRSASGLTPPAGQEPETTSTSAAGQQMPFGRPESGNGYSSRSQTSPSCRRQAETSSTSVSPIAVEPRTATGASGMCIGSGSKDDDNGRVCSDDDGDEHGQHGSGLMSGGVTKRTHSVDDFVEQHSSKKAKYDDQRATEPASVTSSLSVTSQMTTSDDNGMQSGRGVSGIPSADLLQHQLLLSKLASELQSRAFPDIAKFTNNSCPVSDTDGPSNVPMASLLQHHIQQQQQFPPYRRAFDLPTVGAVGEGFSSDGGSSRRPGSGNDVGQQQPRFPIVVPVNGHSVAGTLATQGGSLVSPDVRASPAACSSSTLAVVTNGGSLESSAGSPLSGVVGVPSSPYRLFVPPVVVGRSSCDQTAAVGGGGIDFTLASASARTTKPQQVD